MSGPTPDQASKWPASCSLECPGFNASDRTSRSRPDRGVLGHSGISGQVRRPSHAPVVLRRGQASAELRRLPRRRKCRDLCLQTSGVGGMCGQAGDRARAGRPRRALPHHRTAPLFRAGPPLAAAPRLRGICALRAHRRAASAGCGLDRSPSMTLPLSSLRIVISDFLSSPSVVEAVVVVRVHRGRLPVGFEANGPRATFYPCRGFAGHPMLYSRAGAWRKPLVKHPI